MKEISELDGEDSSKLSGRGKSESVVLEEGRSQVGDLPDNGPKR